MTTAKQNNAQQINYNFLTNENTSANTQTHTRTESIGTVEFNLLLECTTRMYSLHEILHSVHNKHGPDHTFEMYFQEINALYLKKQKKVVVN